MSSNDAISHEFIFPSKHYMPKEITQQAAFLQKYPEYDGRGIKIAIIDDGVDPSCPGLQKTSDGKPKVIECLDLTGAGDVDTSTIRKADKNGILIGLTERELKIPSTWINPSGDWHLGTKAIYELYSKTVKDKISLPIKEKFEKKNKMAIAKVLNELNQHEKNIGIKIKKISDKEDRDEITAKLKFLKDAEKKVEIESPIVDCIVWFDGEKWKACLDTSLTGDLENCKVMSSFRDNQEYEFLSDKCIVTYCFNIFENGNLINICVPDESHGTHVAHIAAGHFPGDPEKDGLAPGAQTISLCIGDLRRAYSSQAFIRALNMCIELKVDIINLSYLVPPSMDSGKNGDFIKNVVEKYGIIFVAGVGNDGPGLSMAGNGRGVTHPSIIYVGGYLTAEMKESMFSHYSADKPVVFPFSSRGPSIDGSLGVTLCAPGAAITGVSKSELQNSKLMAGTSMSSPNAVGNIACLLSAMKAEKIPISPFRVKFALMNTAMAPEDGSHHPLSLGAGIIQIYDAFDFLKSEAVKLIPINLTDIKVDIGGKRGIYLREPFEINLLSEFIVTVRPTFVESGDIESRLNFGCSIILKLSPGSEMNFVKFPKYCQIPSFSFFISVDPSKLENGKVHYAQIVGINPENPALGPMFRIPITVIIPEQITSESDFTYKKELTLEPAIPERIFIESPIGCKYVGIKFKSLENQNIQDLIIQRLYVQLKNVCIKETTKFTLYPKSNVFQNFSCPDGRTIEFCFTRKWDNQNSTNIKITIKFFGLFVTPTTLMDINQTNKIFVTNFFSKTCIEPILEFKSFCQPLNSDETHIEAMEERDIIDGSQSFRLILTYKFNVTKSALYKFKFENLEFYRKYMDSYFLQLTTVSKKHIFTCGIHGKAEILEKGDYIIRVQFCHSDPEILEKLKDARLIAMQTLIPDIICNLYSDAESALKVSGEKINKQNLKSGEKVAIYAAAIPWYKQPSTFSAGSYYTGTLSLHSKETYKSREHSSFEIIYLLTAPKDSEKEKKNRFEIEVDKDTGNGDLKSAIRDIEILYITKETDSTKAVAIFEKLSNEFPKHLPIFSAEIERLSKLKDFSKLKKAVEKLLEISESNKVAEFFGVKSEFSEEYLRKKEIMEKKKSAIINGLFLQANLAFDLFLKSTTKEIPDIFRNGFDPRKESNVVKVGENLNKNKETELAEIETKDLKGIIESLDSYSSDITSKIEKHNEVSKMENPKNDSEEKTDSDESLVKIESIKSESNAKSKIEKSENSEIDKRAFKNDETESVKITEEEIESVFRDYMLFADSSTENAKIIIAKYSVVHERFGTALLKLKEIITDKTTSADYLSTEKAIIQLLKKLKWDHLVEEAQKAILIKHQKFYRLF
uniref:tripeptidyl-peptidase II n=1 Tax=Panagrolaimus davidi TaxID=227884 RepID=A0A914QZ11_9BILA